MKTGQVIEVYKKKTLIGKYTYENKTNNFIRLRAPSGYIETITFTDLRTGRYKLMVDGKEFEIRPIPNYISLEREQKDKDLEEYRRKVHG